MDTCLRRFPPSFVGSAFSSFAGSDRRISGAKPAYSRSSLEKWDENRQNTAVLNADGTSVRAKIRKFGANLTAKTVYYYFMELSTIKQAYEAPTVEVVEIKPEGYILQSSKPDYNPIPW